MVAKLSFLTKAICLHGGLLRFSKQGGVLAVGSVRGLHTKANSKNTSFDWFLTGFTDAEGCFTISISKVSGWKLGWRVRATFAIHLDQRDLPLLNKIKEHLGVGNVCITSKIV